MVAERDVIQANLLELDGSFVRQLLDGATLTGQTRERWQAASATLPACGRPTWRTRPSWTASRNSAPASAARRRRTSPSWTGCSPAACVQLPGASVPLARRDLADTGRLAVTLATAVATMRRSFTAGDRGDLGRRGGLGRRRARRSTRRRRSWPAAARWWRASATSSRRRSATRSPAWMPCGRGRTPIRWRSWHDGRTDTVGRGAAAGGRWPALAARIAEVDRLRAQAQRRIDALRGRDRRRPRGPPGRGRGLAPRRRADHRAAAAAAGHRRAAAGQPGRARGRGPVDPAAGRA